MVIIQIPRYIYNILYYNFTYIKDQPEFVVYTNADYSGTIYR